LLLLSCAPSGRLRRPSPAPTASDLANLLARDIAPLTSLEAEARVSLRLRGIRQNASALVLFRRPADLKVEVTGPFGVRLMTAVASAESLRVFLPRTQELFEGRTDEDVLYRVTGVGLDAWLPWQAILGVTSLDTARVESIRETEGRIRVRVREGNGSRELAFRSTDGTPCSEEVRDAEGRVLVRREMEGYREADGIVLPRRLTVAQGDDAIRLEYRRLRVNPEIAPEHFRLIVPEGVTRVPQDLDRTGP
jgi:hypothetical protein